jgi:hypothetical protein
VPTTFHPLFKNSAAMAWPRPRDAPMRRIVPAGSFETVVGMGAMSVVAKVDRDYEEPALQVPDEGRGNLAFAVCDSVLRRASGRIMKDHTKGVPTA